MRVTLFNTTDLAYGIRRAWLLPVAGDAGEQGVDTIWPSWTPFRKQLPLHLQLWHAELPKDTPMLLCRTLGERPVRRSEPRDLRNKLHRKRPNRLFCFRKLGNTATRADSRILC